MDPIIPALILSKALELGVTEYGLKSNHMLESNPIIQDRATRITVNTFFMAGSPILYKEIRRTKPRLAKVSAVILILGNSYLVYHNLKIIRSAGNTTVPR